MVSFGVFLQNCPQFFRFFQKVSDLLGRAAAVVVVVVCGLINDHQFLYEKGLINEPHFMS